MPAFFDLPNAARCPGQSVRRTLCALCITFIYLMRAQALSAQAGASASKIFREAVPGVSGTAQSIRYQLQKVLLEQSISISEIGACDCIVTTEWTRLSGLPRGRAAKFRVHILKLPSALRATVYIEAMEVPVDNLAVMPQSIVEDTLTPMSPPLRLVVTALRNALQSALLPPRR